MVANIGGVAEAEEVLKLGGEGIGLLRSEFLFLHRSEAPLEAEQTAVYTAIATTMGPERDMVVRTLDVGGDKPLSYLPLPHEDNPFLGIRGIRLNLINKDILSAQIRAILPAAKLTRLHIMFPMVSMAEEFREAKNLVLTEMQSLGIKDNVKIGAMVEVPSAALLAETIAKDADFFSIGTNDLAQYTLAMDRGNPRFAPMADAVHPSVLNLIAKTVDGAHKYGKWVGVCGGLASEAAAVPLLLGLGIDELSVTPAALPTIKAAVRRQNLDACRQLAGDALGMSSSAEVRARLAIYKEE